MGNRSIVSIIDTYFRRFQAFDRQIQLPPHSDVKVIVVIPCYGEDGLSDALNSLGDCEGISNEIEVVVVVNAPENASKEILSKNLASCSEVKSFEARNGLPFHLIEAFGLPQKHAGVGWARKIGMDEALRRFSDLNKDGVILCFDADSRCSPNYLKEVMSHFESFPECNGVSIHFEHPLFGNEFSPQIYRAITHYELHLRYYRNALRYCELPYAFHTIGSSMAARASAYALQGGMNRRKAGEDFYFLNKIMALGNFMEINTAMVIPSPRSSDRVPFGTGRAVGEALASGKYFESYSFDIFHEVKEVFRAFKQAFYQGVNLDGYSFPEGVEKVRSTLNEIMSQTNSFDTYCGRVYHYFDAFWVLKYVHYRRDMGLLSKGVMVESLELLKKIGDNSDLSLDAARLLHKFRLLDKVGF